MAILSWATALSVFGVWSVGQVPLEWMPEVELPEIYVRTSWPGATPRSIERYVTAPIERVIADIPGTEETESGSSEGSSFITVRVARGTDLAPFVARVNEQISAVRPVLPEGVEPVLTKKVPESLENASELITAQIVGSLSPDQLRAYAEEELVPDLYSLPGVSSVELSGGTTREVIVRLAPSRMAAYGVTSADVSSRIIEATTDDSWGRIRLAGQSLPVLVPAEASLSRLRELPVAPSGSAGGIVRVGDVGTIALAPAPLESISRVDGQPVVTMSIKRMPGSPILVVASKVRAFLDAARESLPPDTRILIIDDTSDEARAQLRDLAWRGGLGVLLVALVLSFMLRSKRAAAVVLLTVAAALAACAPLLGLMDLTLNIVTLAGLAVVIGLLVDNVVVVMERILEERIRGRNRDLRGLDLDVFAATNALRSVALPLLGGTLTTAVVVFPLLYLSGEFRTLFLPLGVVVAMSLAASLLLAALVVPVLARVLPDPTIRRMKLRKGWVRRVLEAPVHFGGRFPKATLLLATLIVGIPLWALPAQIDVDEGTPQPVERLAGLYNATVGSSTIAGVRDWLAPKVGGISRVFFRDTRFVYRERNWGGVSDEVYVNLTVPPGSSAEQVDSLIRPFEREALAEETVSRTVLNVGRERASLTVSFEEDALATFRPLALRERLIARGTTMGGVRLWISGLVQDGFSIGGGVFSTGTSVEAYGPSYDELTALAQQFADRMRAASPGRVAGVDIDRSRFGWQPPRQTLVFRTGDALGQAGATVRQVREALRPILTPQQVVGWIHLAGEGDLPIHVILQGVGQAEATRLSRTPLPLTDSTAVLLQSVAPFEIETQPAQIERRNQRYRRYIGVDFRGPHQLQEAVIEQVLSEMEIPSGYELTTDRSPFFDTEARQSMWGVFLAALILVFLVTASVFESWRLPWAVLLSVPMALIGLGAGFLCGEATFNPGTFIGAILLVGIAVNDAILMVDRYRTLAARWPQRPARDLARLAFRERLHPMWTTTITTVVALLPILYLPGADAFWIGFATAVAFGLLAATLLGPIVATSFLSLQSSAASRQHSAISK